MNTIKFCFIAPILFLIQTESIPIAQPPITPSHVLHIRKDLPGIISFGPIFISSVKRGIFTDHVSVHSCNGCPYGSHDLVDCKEKPDTPEIVEVEEPLEVISVEEKPDEDDGEMNDIISDYDDFRNKSTLTSQQIFSIQAVELDRMREKELNHGFEVLNQVKEVPDELEPEKEVETFVEEPSYVQSGDYVHVMHSDPKPGIPQGPEIEPKPQENPFGTQNFEHDSTLFQGLPSEPNEPLYPVHEVIQPEESLNEPLNFTPEKIQNEVHEGGNGQESSPEANIWNGPTSPEVAQSINEYMEYHKPGEIYPCPPKDSTQISERHDNLIKYSLTGESKRIKNYFNGVRAYAARYDDTIL